ncbi:MAG: ABC transporter substrate-binding protein [Lautropia sp.]
MTKDRSKDFASGGLSRRSVLQSAAAALSIPIVTTHTVAWARDKLAGSGEVVAYTPGGAHTEGARKHVFEPFTKATGIKVIDVNADIAEPQVNAMVRANKVDWDWIQVQAQNFPGMAAQGMFAPIDYSLWDAEALEGVAQSQRHVDRVPVGSSSMVLAYDARVYPNPAAAPKSWTDFWDVKKFPGPRGLYGIDAKRNIQFALLADGMAPQDIWPMTDDKLDRAFKKLDEIKPHVTKWWVGGGEAPQLLINKEYVMTSAFNNRMIIAVRGGAPVRFGYDGAYTNRTWAAVLKNGPNPANAQKLVAFMNRAQIAAGWTLGTAFPGGNTNQLKFLPDDLRPLLPITPENSAKSVIEDSEWLPAQRPDGKTNVAHMQERWLAWRARA